MAQEHKPQEIKRKLTLNLMCKLNYIRLKGCLFLGYKPRIIRKKITEDISISREVYFKYQTKSKTDHVSLIFSYYLHFKAIHKIDKNLHICKIKTAIFLYSFVL